MKRSSLHVRVAHQLGNLSGASPTELADVVVEWMDGAYRAGAGEVATWVAGQLAGIGKRKGPRHGRPQIPGTECPDNLALSAPEGS